MAIEPIGAYDVGYESKTVYEAKVETGDKIYFMFYHASGASHMQITRSDVSDSGWLDYLLIADEDLCYHTPNGVWILHTPKECSPTWLFHVETAVKQGMFYAPIITRVSDKAVVHSVVRVTPDGRRHYDMVIKDDIIEKEVKGKVYLQMFDVIFFNRETKLIDFREDMIAESPEEVYLLAVQKFGKYDPKVHVKQANGILGFDEIKEK